VNQLVDGRVALDRELRIVVTADRPDYDGQEHDAEHGACGRIDKEIGPDRGVHCAFFF